MEQKILTNKTWKDPYGTKNVSANKNFEWNKNCSKMEKNATELKFDNLALTVTLKVIFCGFVSHIVVLYGLVWPFLAIIDSNIWSCYESLYKYWMRLFFNRRKKTQKRTSNFFANIFCEINASQRAFWTKSFYFFSCTWGPVIGKVVHCLILCFGVTR